MSSPSSRSSAGVMSGKSSQAGWIGRTSRQDLVMTRGPLWWRPRWWPRRLRQVPEGGRVIWRNGRCHPVGGEGGKFLEPRDTVLFVLDRQLGGGRQRHAEAQ